MCHSPTTIEFAAMRWAVRLLCEATTVKKHCSESAPKDYATLCAWFVRFFVRQRAFFCFQVPRAMDIGSGWGACSFSMFVCEFRVSFPQTNAYNRTRGSCSACAENVFHVSFPHRAHTIGVTGAIAAKLNSLRHKSQSGIVRRRRHQSFRM